MAGLTYRPEISGLRAIAVLAVIVYHAGADWLPGGFVGVDVFFVISGYLITSILYREAQSGGIAFAAFYARRVKRLVPASTAMVLVAMVAGYWLLYAGAYDDLAQSALYSLGFSANFYFLGHSGYFDQATEVSPLAHMWSLGVEEQFYLLYPALVALAVRGSGRRGLPLLLGVVVVSSFAANVYLSDAAPVFAFYMLPTRAWELGLGGLLALPTFRRAPDGGWATLLAALGLAMMGYGIVTTSSEDAFPGWAALAPVLGTGLVIHATGSGTNIVARLLGARPMRVIGESSYSAYLWHWPLVVFYRVYISERAFTATEQAVLIALALAVGWLSWRLIEQPFRTAQVRPGRVLGLTAATLAVAAIWPRIVEVKLGFPHRIPSSFRAMTNSSLMGEWDCPRTMTLPFGESACLIGLPWRTAKVRGLVIGDSHAHHFTPVLHEAAKEAGVALAATILRCPMRFPPSLPMQRRHRRNYTPQCYEQVDRMLAWLRRNKSVHSLTVAWAWSSGQLVKLFGKGDGQQDDLSRSAWITAVGLAGFVEQLPLGDLRLLLLGDVPRPRRRLNDCVARSHTPLWREPCADGAGGLDAVSVRAWHGPTNRVLVSQAAAHPAITALIPTETLCDEAQCSTFVNGEFIYRDSHHIRRNLSPETLLALARQIGLVDYFTNLRREVDVKRSANPQRVGDPS